MRWVYLLPVLETALHGSISNSPERNGIKEFINRLGKLELRNLILLLMLSEYGAFFIIQSANDCCCLT